MTPPDGAPGLSVKATVRRGDFELEVSFDVPGGQVLAVLGPNGAGKSTLLRAIAGLTPIQAGHIRIGNRTLNEPLRSRFVEAHHRRTALVFQDHRLFPHLSVRENIGFGPRSRGVGRLAVRGIVEPLLVRFELTELAERKPPTLSGGQAQRVALARALAAEPDVLLLDEPLAAVDAGSRGDVRGQIGAHLHQFPGPCLFVTHDLLDALSLADQVLIIEHGSIVQLGTPHEVITSPATDYVAALVAVNFNPPQTPA